MSQMMVTSTDGPRGDARDSAYALTGDPIVNEAKKRFERCADWEAQARQNFIEDYKFAHGDSLNGFQWPDAMRRNRDVDKRPCLTMNIVRQHNLQITNEGKQNKSSVAVRAVGSGATKEAADVFEACIRRIEYQSDAQDAYSTAFDYAVDGGIGWWRIVTQWESNDSFDQDIFIERVKDPLSIYMDPDCEKKDCSDARFAFVFVTLSRDEFLQNYPKHEAQATRSPLGVASGDSDYVLEDIVRVCEYFRRIKRRDDLVSFIEPSTGQRLSVRRSKLPQGVFDKVAKDPLSKTREVWDEVIEWKLIAADEVIDETIWPGSYIPLVRVIGEEVIVGGVMDRKGHTRAMLDAQRMYNYNCSAQVEFVALQSRTPYVAAAKAIEEYESMWNTANQVNHSVLLWNHVDDNDPGTPIPPPQRQEPPNFAPGFEKGMETAFNQMMMTSGQWQNQMGMMGNERTGSAIKQRQAQSDTSVYHFQDNYGQALRYTGKQLLELIPKIYNTRRVFVMQADDGEDFDVEINPQTKLAFQKRTMALTQSVLRIFNPQVGKYDIEADVGAAYGTRRQETVDALTLILTQNPGLTAIVGDILLRAMDFKEAQEASQRLRRMVPPQALGEGPSMQEQKLQAQLATLQGTLAKALQRQGSLDLKLEGKDQMRDIDVYKAQTDRFKALADTLQLDPVGLRAVIEELYGEAMATKLAPILQANKDDLDAEEQDGKAQSAASAASTSDFSHLGAQRAPDGEWYLSDPTRRGRYLRIAPLAQERKTKGVLAGV